MNETFLLALDLSDNQMLRRVLRPRTNRRVMTTTLVVPNPDTSLVGHARFFDSGWAASGTISRLPNGHVKVVYTTSWTELREVIDG
jgi:hypothetical protein